MSGVTLTERTVSLEVEVRHLTNKVETMNEKLDALLALRDRGTGAFWLVSIIFGTGLIGGVTTFLHWLKG